MQVLCRDRGVHASSLVRTFDLFENIQGYDKAVSVESGQQAELVDDGEVDQDRGIDRDRLTRR